MGYSVKPPVHLSTACSCSQRSRRSPERELLGSSEGGHGAAVFRRDVDMLTVMAHGDGDRAEKSHAVGAGATRPVLAHAASERGILLDQLAGRLVPSEVHNGAAAARRDVDVPA